MWFALSQCLKINPCERSSLNDVLRALTNNMVQNSELKIGILLII